MFEYIGGMENKGKDGMDCHHMQSVRRLAQIDISHFKANPATGVTNEQSTRCSVPQGVGQRLTLDVFVLADRLLKARLGHRFQTVLPERFGEP